MTSIPSRLRASRAALTTFLSALAGSAVGPALLLAAVAGAGTFVALDATHRADTIETSALRQSLTTSPQLDQTITSEQDLAQVEQSIYGYPLQALSSHTLGQIKQSLNQSLARQGVPVGASAQNWIGLTADAGLLPVSGSKMPDVSWLVWRDTLSPLHLISGRLPQNYTAAAANTPATFEVALSQETATAVHAHVGSVLDLSEGSAGDVALTVTGIFEPTDAASAY